MLGYKLIFLSFVFNPATIHGSLLANQPFIVGGVEGKLTLVNIFLHET